MSNIQVRSIDRDGVWFVNRSQYRWVHGLREGVWFEPGQPTQVVEDAWTKAQAEAGVLVAVEDPFALPKIEPITSVTPLDGGTANLGADDAAKAAAEATKAAEAAKAEAAKAEAAKAEAAKQPAKK